MDVISMRLFYKAQRQDGITREQRLADFFFGVPDSKYFPEAIWSLHLLNCCSTIAAGDNRKQMSMAESQ